MFTEDDVIYTRDKSHVSRINEIEMLIQKLKENTEDDWKTGLELMAHGHWRYYGHGYIMQGTDAKNVKFTLYQRFSIQHTVFSFRDFSDFKLSFGNPNLVERQCTA